MTRDLLSDIQQLKTVVYITRTATGKQRWHSYTYSSILFMSYLLAGEQVVTFDTLIGETVNFVCVSNTRAQPKRSTAVCKCLKLPSFLYSFLTKS